MPWPHMAHALHATPQPRPRPFHTRARAPFQHQVTSHFLHFFPACVSWAARFHPSPALLARLEASPEDRQRWESARLQELSLLPMLPYCLWAVLYYAKVGGRVCVVLHMDDTVLCEVDGWVAGLRRLGEPASGPGGGKEEGAAQ